MAERAGVERMERLGFGALQPAAGMAALGAILRGLAGQNRLQIAPPALMASVMLWERCYMTYCISAQNNTSHKCKVTLCFMPACRQGASADKLQSKNFTQTEERNGAAILLSPVTAP
jgi:hypothetical protein